jgi:DNA-directed RNA polymerase beta subunit
VLLQFDRELALGKNILVTYMPWKGYNSEDVVIINEHLNRFFLCMHDEFKKL